MKMKKKITLAYFAKNLTTVIGLVLIWRGIWYVLDAIDMMFLENNHLITALAGVILGLFILYIPDKDLKEIEKL